jgi:hypothetical protein
MSGVRITHTTRVTGKTSGEDVQLPVDVVDAGVNVRVTFHDPKGEVEQVLEGEKAWMRDKDGVHAMPRAGEINLRAVFPAQRPVLPSSFTGAARTTGKEGDRWIVTQGKERFWFDAGSGLLVRKVTLMETPIGTITQQTDFDDYREVAGVRFPHRIRVLLVDPWTSATWEYATVKVGSTD